MSSVSIASSIGSIYESIDEGKECEFDGIENFQLCHPSAVGHDGCLEVMANVCAGTRVHLMRGDRQSLAYTVSASNIEGLAPGYFSLYIATAPDKMKRARAGMFEEIDRLLSERPDPEERGEHRVAQNLAGTCARQGSKAVAWDVGSGHLST